MDTLDSGMDKVEGELEYLDDLLRISTLVGRQKELTQLKSILQKGGKTILLHGESGLGKTRLVRELLQVFEKRGGIILAGSCHEETRSIPYYPFRDAFKRFFEKVGVQSALGGEPLQNLPEYSQKELESILPELRQKLVSESLPSGAGVFERAPDPYRLFEAVLLLLQNISVGAYSNTPLLLIIEDLHKSDEASLDLLQYLARNIKSPSISPFTKWGQRGIFLIGTYRTEEVESNRGIIRLLSSLRREKLIDEIKLLPLSPEGVNSMIQVHFPGVEVSQEFQDFLYEKTDGNPFFVEEILRSLNMDEIRKGESPFAKWEVPPSIHDLIQGRVDLLPQEIKETLTCAALLGEEFEFEVLRKVLNRREEEILEAVEEGMRSRIIQESSLSGSGEGERGGGERYRFQNALMADVLYSGIGKTRRRLWHGKAGEVLEEIYGTGEMHARFGQYAPTIAYHFERGERWEKAVIYDLKGAWRAKEDYAHQEAIHLFEKAREMLTRLRQSTSQAGSAKIGEEEERTIAEGLGDIYKITGNYGDAQKEYKSLEESARGRGDLKVEGKALDKMGEVFRNQGNFDDSIMYAERSYETYRKTDDQKGLARSLSNIGVVQAKRGDYEEALRCFDESLRIRKEIGDKRDEADSFGSIGVVHGNRGDYEDALRCFEDSLLIRREIGDKWGESSSLINIGLVHWNLGEYGEALKCFEKSLKIQREIGDIKGEALSLNSIGNVRLNQGEHDEALKCYKKTLEIQRKIGDKWGMAFTLQNIGVVHWYRREYQEELKCEEESLSIRREMGDRMGISMSLNNIGDVYRILGDYEKALECFEESLLLRREIGDKRYSSMTLKNIGVIHSNRGNYGKAMKSFEESSEIQKETRSKKDRVETLVAIGSMHRNLFDVEKALENHQESLRLAEEIGAKDEKARILTEIGTDHYLKGDNEKALQVLHESMENFLKLGLKNGEPEVQGVLSEVFLSNGNLEKSKEYCDSLMEMSEKGGEKGHIAWGRKIRGEILLTVAESSDSGSSVATRVEDPIRVATTLKEAETELLEALRIAEEIGAKPLQWQIYASLGKLYESPLFSSPLTKGGIERGVQNLGDSVGAGFKPAQAKEHYTKAKEIIEEIASTIPDEELKKTFLNAKPVQAILQGFSEK